MQFRIVQSPNCAKNAASVAALSLSPIIYNDALIKNERALHVDTATVNAATKIVWISHVVADGASDHHQGLS